MTDFDPQAFMQTKTDAEFDTTYTPVPEREYKGLIDSVVPHARTVDGEERVVVDVLWNIVGEDDLKEKLGFDDKMIVKQSVWPDRGANGALLTGPNHNVDLAQLLAAVGLNKKGKPWSWNDLIGKGPCSLKVVQKTDTSFDPPRTYANVKNVGTA